MASLPRAARTRSSPRLPIRSPRWRAKVAALGVVALGGVLGASARYGIGLLLPHAPGTFPLGTLLINVVGGFLIGVLIDAVAARPLLRPFAVTGILGGFTTFSTYAVDAEQLLAAGRLAHGRGLPGRHARRRARGHLAGARAGPAGAPVIPLLVIVGAAVGAPLRYATDRVVQARHDTGFPWGTFTVNVVGSFVLGVVVARGRRPRWSRWSARASAARSPRTRRSATRPCSSPRAASSSPCSTRSARCSPGWARRARLGLGCGERALALVSLTAEEQLAHRVDHQPGQRARPPCR